MLNNLTILITGGTGTLGKAVLKRIMTGELGKPKKVLILSRDELKQHEMRVEWLHGAGAVEDLRDFSPKDVIEFHLGDVRVYDTLLPVLRRADVIVNAAALKQVPQCEYSPFEAVRTNIEGPYNIVRAIREHRLPVQKVVTISTDKACKPVNVMGMTKAIQERLILAANADYVDTSFMAVRYGNVLASRGSVIPHFTAQIASGGPVTITSPEMTRFLLTVDQAVDTVVEALRFGKRGETIIPCAPAALVMDIARAMTKDKQIEIKEIGVRPGEKIDEILISEEECWRTNERNQYYVIKSILPLPGDSLPFKPARSTEYSSRDNLLSLDGVTGLLASEGLLGA